MSNKFYVPFNKKKLIQEVGASKLSKKKDIKNDKRKR